jgi:glutamine cyclotransferase
LDSIEKILVAASYFRSLSNKTAIWKKLIAPKHTRITMKKKNMAGIAAGLIMLSVSSIAYLLLTDKPTESFPLLYTCDIVRDYPHDANAFTQGLVFEDGVLYEGTGLWGNSTLRKVELETGRVLKNYALADEFFGEGITIFGDSIIQLTWQSQMGFVYDKSSFNLLSNFSYAGEGWGITHDHHSLIVSNGSATLQIIDPETFEITRQIQVHDGNETIAMLNELEFVRGDIYANIWQQDRIAIINVQNGQVKGWIDLAGLYIPENSDANDVLNGIAYDAHTDRLFVTGKRWAKLFEIKITLRK